MAKVFSVFSSLGGSTIGYIVPPIFYEKIIPRVLNW